MADTRYSRVVPNSHSFGRLENILVSWEYQPSELTKDYLLIGFRNTLERGFEIRKIDKTKEDQPIIYKSIYDIIHLIENGEDVSLNMIISIIKSTIASGYDLKPKHNMEREEIYDRLDTERQYQDLRWTPRREKNNTPDESKPPAEWINYIEYHITRAKESVYLLNEQDALHEVRKVAALAIRCMELHGCPERVIPADLLVKDNENKD